jgi:hypothetical protein
LILTSCYGKLDIVQYLISKGANIEEIAIDLTKNDKIKEILKNTQKNK